MDGQKIADAIRERREQRGIKQDELGLLIGHSQTFISYLEAGIRKPSVETLEKLAAELRLVFTIGPNGTDVKSVK